MAQNLLDKLSISILDFDIGHLEESLVKLQEIGIKGIHIDIIDTSFTENISFGIETVNTILQYAVFDFFIHIMVSNPHVVIKKLKYAKGTKIATHSHFDELLMLEDIVPVLAISPDQSLESLESIISKFHEVLVMTVHPGAGGQELIESCIEKIDKLQERGLSVTVDGGVNVSTISKVKHADLIVVGSALTRSSNKLNTLKELLKNMQ